MDELNEMSIDETTDLRKRATPGLTIHIPDQK